MHELNQLIIIHFFTRLLGFQFAHSAKLFDQYEKVLCKFMSGLCKSRKYSRLSHFANTIYGLNGIREFSYRRKFVTQFVSWHEFYRISADDPSLENIFQLAFMLGNEINLLLGNV